MTVYSVDKLIEQLRHMARDWREAKGEPLPGISSEIATHDAIRLLNLEPADQGLGYDAVGRGRWGGKRIQIKGRAIFDEDKAGQRIGQLKAEQEWDSVMLVLLDASYEPFEIYEVERGDALAAVAESEGSKRAKRGVMSVAKFKAIGRRVWTRENGIEDEVWDNQAG